MKKSIFTVCLLALVSCGKSPVVQWVATTPTQSWLAQSADSIAPVKSDSADLVIDLANPQQTIDGFGTCFTELGWTSLSRLSEADRESVMAELFTPGLGANFKICRMPVGANDFSRDWYSYNETDGDFEMKNFSIANDLETLVPFIKNAQKYNPDLKIWASPWSPPTWMKDNRHYACQPLQVGFFHSIGEGGNGMRQDQIRAEGMNMFIQDDAYFEAYALYFAKFIEAYRAENINIFMVMPQNEFNSCQPFPSCTWTASGLNRFIGGFLGPKMKALGVELMFGTMERPTPALADTSLQDPESSKYLVGAGFQWDGKRSIGDIHRRYPQLKIYQTEQECGNGANDWRGAVHAWRLMKHYFGNGTNVYDYWNTSLLKGGMSRWGWTQNSLVVVDSTDNTFKYTYEYYVLKHLSHYVQSGAQYLPVSGRFAEAMAFRNPDGAVVVMAFNREKEQVKPVVKLGDRSFELPLQPESFNTIVIK
jgi:glucosylceramidase